MGIRDVCRKCCGPRNAEQKKSGPLSKNDTNSFSNPDEVKVEKVHLVWNIDFVKDIIAGSATYHIVANKAVDEIVFDVRDLNVSKVEEALNGSPLDFSFGTPIENHGQSLSIKLPPLNSQCMATIKIEYATSPKAAGLQWLTKEQTLMKTLPYVFSQCQSIFARSLLPCQDTPSAKFTYSAEVTAIKEVEVLMSAMKLGSTITNDSHATFHFEQNIPIPAYLIAIAAGGIENERMGPRSNVWAEVGFLELAASDFSETEKMLQIAEQMFGEYVWGVYDILVLPPSFPHGGMEHPCLAFVSPSLLTGDSSLVSVIAHEICHCWFGNLVTNSTYEHFWLNEGFTVFAERKVLGVLKGEEYRQFRMFNGLTELSNDVKAMKPDNPLTKLVPNLDFTTPEDSFSLIPYEKGSTFLYFLEQKVGGPSVFEPYLKAHISRNSYKSIDTNTWKSQFIAYFTESGNENLIADIDWDGWLYSTGMPLIIPGLDSTLNTSCINLKDKWVGWNHTKTGTCPFNKNDLSGWHPKQVATFLAELLEDENLLGLDKVKDMQAAYDFNSVKNGDIYSKWISLCLRNHWKAAVPLALEYVTENGRLTFIRPIYQEMSKNKELRSLAIKNLSKIKPTRMRLTINSIEKDLNIY